MCRVWWEGQRGVGADVIVMKKRTERELGEIKG